MDKQEPVAWHEPDSFGNVTTHKKWALENGWKPLYTAPVDAVNISQECVDETAKCGHEPVAFPDAPTTIYLQVCDDMDCGESFYDHTDVSWCDDQINDSDIKYIRADIAPPKRKWVDLDEEEQKECWDEGGSQWAIYQNIASKLKEKNT